jgi:hypothetical protein
MEHVEERKQQYRVLGRDALGSGLILALCAMGLEAFVPESFDRILALPWILLVSVLLCLPAMLGRILNDQE